MAKSADKNQRDAEGGAGCGPRVDAAQSWPAQSWWSQHREASLNWLALGLLLAAWNASDNDAAGKARGRPEVLRGYSIVSVRAAQRTRLCGSS